MPAEKRIRVTEETREELRRIGSKGDTYDDIIQRLIEIRERAKSMDLIPEDA